MISRPSVAQMPMLAMVGALYLSQGVPLGIAMEALPSLLRQQGASLQMLSLLPLVGLPWIVKFLWAPFVDNVWSARIGKRRSWILPMQALVTLSMIGVALAGVSGQTTGIVIALLALAALASATQDTATDGLSAEQFEGTMLVRANTIQVAGTMIGFFLGGAGCLTLTGMVGQRFALSTMAGLALGAFLLALWWREPGSGRARADCPSASLKRFLKRPGALAVLAIGFGTAMTASAAFGLSKLFLVDQGWTLAQIGRVGMSGGVATILIGCGGGGWLINRIGLTRVMVGGVLALGTGALVWLAMAGAVLPPSLPTVLAAIILGSIGSGSASVAAMTLAMRFAARADQAGTDMTAMQSMRDFGELATSMAATGLAGMIGYGWVFGAALCGALSLSAFVPALVRSSGSAKHSVYGGAVKT